jgi:hypothetical protein
MSWERCHMGPFEMACQHDAVGVMYFHPEDIHAPLIRRCGECDFARPGDVDREFEDAPCPSVSDRVRHTEPSVSRVRAYKARHGHGRSAISVNDATSTRHPNTGGNTGGNTGADTGADTDDLGASCSDEDVR